MNVSAEWVELLAPMAARVLSPALESANGQIDAEACIETAAVKAGLDEFLSEASAEGVPLLVVVNDTHRYTDSNTALRVLSKACKRLGLQMPFRLLVATGSHTFAIEEEKRQHEIRVLEGGLEQDCVGIDWHDAFDEGRLTRLSIENSPWLHAWLVESRHVVAVGSMEPHYFAGITGAHKTLTVGLMAYEDIKANHVHALSAEATGMRLDGNPIFEGLARTVGMLEQCGKRLFALNELLSGGRVIRCWAGHPLRCLHEARPQVLSCFAHVLPQPQDLVVSVVNPPLDRDFYQADKGIKNVEAVVRDGGVILLDAACSGGIGIDRFYALLRKAFTHESAVKAVADEGYVLGDHKAVRLRALTDSRNVRLGAYAPGLTPVEAQTCGMRLFDSRIEAARWALGEVGAAARAVVVNDAGNATLLLKPE